VLVAAVATRGRTDVNEHVGEQVMCVGRRIVYCVAGLIEPVTTACTERGLICCHVVASAGRVVSSGRSFTLVFALKCRRRIGKRNVSEVATSLEIVNERVPVVADAPIAGTKVAPSIPKERAIAAGNRLVTHTD